MKRDAFDLSEYTYNTIHIRDLQGWFENIILGSKTRKLGSKKGKENERKKLTKGRERKENIQDNNNNKRGKYNVLLEEAEI